MEIEIQAVTSLPLEELAPLVEESESEGFFPLGRLVRAWQSGENRFDQPGEALFVARREERIVGICGLNRDPYLSDPQTARVRHLYVAITARGSGVGGQLVRAVIQAARGPFTRLRLRTDCPIAARFYRSLGFLATPDDPTSTHAMELSAAARAN
jgi:GNAT superfamily N-acetyltransferase